MAGGVHRVADPEAATDAVAGRFASGRQDELDGLTIEWDDEWFNLRPSNTEPLLRLNLEASDAALMSAKRDELVALLGEPE